MPSLTRYEKVTPFLEFSVNGKKLLKIVSYKFFVNMSFELLQSKYFNFLRSFQIIVFLTNFTQKPFSNRYEKVKCDNCSTQTTKLNLGPHQKSCSAETLYCSQCPNFPTKSQNDLNYRIAKKHSAPKPDINFKCKLCHKNFQPFMLYGNTKTLNMESRSDQEQEMRMWRTLWDIWTIKV